MQIEGKSRLIVFKTMAEQYKSAKISVYTELPELHLFLIWLVKM
jgi:hypothetical protein